MCNNWSQNRSIGCKVANYGRTTIPCSLCVVYTDTKSVWKACEKRWKTTSVNPRYLKPMRYFHILVLDYAPRINSCTKTIWKSHNINRTFFSYIYSHNYDSSRREWVKDAASFESCHWSSCRPFHFLLHYTSFSGHKSVFLSLENHMCTPPICNTMKRCVSDFHSHKSYQAFVDAL